MQSTVRVLAKLVCGVFLLAACEPAAKKGNPFNLPGMIGYWAMDVVEAPDGTLIVGSSNVASNGTVQRVDGSTVTELAKHEGNYLRVAGGFVYIGLANPTIGGTGLVKMPVTGGRLEPLLHYGIHGLAVDDDYVYWLTSDPKERIFRLPHSGGTTEVFLEAPEGLGSLEADDTHLYWITLQGVSRVAKAGGEEEKLLEPDEWEPYLDSWPLSLALSERYVFVAGGAGFVGARGAVVRFDKDGDNVTLVADGQDSASLTLADDDYVYWVRGYTNDATPWPGHQDIVRKPLEGGREEIIADQQNGVTSMLRSAEGLYWTCRNERYLNFAHLR